MDATQTPAAGQHEARCLAPHCGRKLTDPRSIARGFGPVCWAKVREAAKTADLSPWTPAQVADARQAIEDGAVVPSTREGVFHVVSTDGAEVHRTSAKGCNCTNGLLTRPSRPCYHRCAVAIVLASQAPAPAPALAPAPVALPSDAELWAAMDRWNDAYMAMA